MTRTETMPTSPDARQRRMEEERRSHIKALRRSVAEAGYEGTLRLSNGRTPGVYEMWVDPVDGIGKRELRQTVGDSRTPADLDALTAQALRMADLAMIAGRRNAAVRGAGGDPRSPPAWAFLGHPIMRGVIALRIADPQRYRPLDPTRWQECELVPTVHDLRIGHTGVKLAQPGGAVRIDAASQVARLVMPGEYPDAIVTTLKGRPIGDLLGLPGLERGTPAGDTPIQGAWVKNGTLRVTVECRLVPLADAPGGIDAAWLQEWSERHYR